MRRTAVPAGGGTGVGRVAVTRRGLFVGLCTLDVIQLVERAPGPNEKVTSLRQTVAAGGPAANVAAAFARLGGAATLLTGIGSHPLAAGITADLAGLGVRVTDLDGRSAEPPAVSAVLVTRGTGERAVASANTGGRRLPVPNDPAAAVADAQVVEFDGHHMDLAVAVARAARSAGALTVFDGGSWKPGTERLLRHVDVAVCSADFRPPGAGERDVDAVLGCLRAHGVPWAAVSRGGAPVVWRGPRGAGGTVAVPEVRVVDTLGAGDVLHGALAHHLPERPRMGAEAFADALGSAAAVAARACASFGTRAWMRD